MQDRIFFNNSIAYMVVSPLGGVDQSGTLKNAVGYRVKDQVLRAFTTAAGANAGTVMSANFMGFRTDGSAILGSVNQWYLSGTAISTMYNNSTYVTSIAFSGTYTATANVTCKTVGLFWTNTFTSGSDIGSFCNFYSTNMNMSVGSGGKIIIVWTVNI